MRGWLSRLRFGSSSRLVMDASGPEIEPRSAAEVGQEVAVPDHSLLAGIRHDPMRLAWTVILTAFLVFCLLLVLVITGSRYVYRHAKVPGELLLQSTIGTVYLYNGGDEPIAVTEPVSDFNENSRLITPGEAKQGVLGLFRSSTSGGMLNSVQLSSDTILDVIKARRPLFRRSGQPHEVHLVLHQGQVRVVTLMPQDLTVNMRIDTPHGQVKLADGIYRIAVDDQQTQVTVLDGMAQGHNGAEDKFTLEEGNWIGFTPESVSIRSHDVAAELVTNGSFQTPLQDSWEQGTVANNVPPPSMAREFQDGRWVVHFWRDQGDNAHNQYELRQQIGRNVALHERLYLRLNLRIDYQSLAGAGVLSSEFPIRVELGYTDIYGQERTWGHGFYYRDPIPGYWIENGEQVPAGTWFAYESPDLFNLLALTRPETLNYVRIHASGHDYDAYVSQISLVAQ